MSLPVTIPNTFANATSAIPLSQLDTNFSTLANVINDINSGAQTLANLKASNVEITGGIISNVTLDNVTVDVETLSNVTINGGNVTVTNMVATTANATTGNITTVNATTVDTTNIEVTNIKAKDGTASASIADSTGVFTHATATVFPAGAVGTPSITTAGDTNTGIYFPTADTIAFTEGGAESMRIDSSGNVGIGTSSPLAKLNTYAVNGGGEAATLFQNFSLTTNTTVALYLSPTNGSLTTGSIRAGFIKAINVGGSVTALTFGTNSSGADPTEKMRIDSSGNVGIGTSSPTSALYVKSTTGVIATLDGSGTTTGAINTGAALLLNGHDGVVLRSFGQINGFKENGTSGNYAGYLAFQTRPNGGSLTERMRITSTGDVGIGTSSPSGRLAIGALAGQAVASILTDMASSVDANATIPFNAPSLEATRGSTTRGTFIKLTNNNAGYAGIGSNATASNGHDMRFYSGDGSERMRIDSSGNLLLGGTATPASATASLAIFNGTAPTGSVTNGIVLYAEDVSSSSELKVRDEAGNVTTLSPHNFSIIPEGPSEDMAWAYYSEKNGKRINVDMLKLARMVEKLTGEKLVYTD